MISQAVSLISTAILFCLDITITVLEAVGGVGLVMSSFVILMSSSYLLAPFFAHVRGGGSDTAKKRSGKKRSGKGDS